MEKHCGLQFALPDDVTARWASRGKGGHVLSSITRPSNCYSLTHTFFLFTLATWLMFLKLEIKQ